jgi:hypothetical protein
MCAKYRIPYQNNLELNLPDPNQLFRVKGSNTLGYVKDNQIYTTGAADFSTLQKYTRQPGTGIGANMGAADLGDWTPTQEHEQSGISQLKSLYGIDVNSLPEFSTGEAENLYKFNTAGGLDWKSILSGGNLGGTPGGTTTRTIDPNNPNRAIDVAGDVSSGAPADYLSKLLGTGQGAGGAYNNTPAQAQALYPNLQNEVASQASGGTGTTGGQQKTLIDIANSRPDVLNTAKAQGGDPFTAGTAANTWLNNWWNQSGKNEYPGTTLTQPSNTPQTGNQGVNTGGAGSTGTGAGASYDANDPRTVLANMLTKMMKQQEDLMNFYKNQPTAMDNYQKYSDQLGYGTQQKQQVGLASQINKTEQTLNDLEKNITSRITSLGEGMSEAQRARQYATEKKQPMEDYTNLVKQYNQGEAGLSSARTQLADLMKYAQSDQEKAAELAGMPLEYSQKMLPTLMSAAEYRSPQEKLADKIAEEKAMKAGGLGSYYDKPSNSSTTDSTAVALGINPKDAAAFNTAFQEQYEKVLAGTYGTQGAREKAGQAMLVKYPQYANAIWKKVYGDPVTGTAAIFPNGYESQIKSSSQGDIPQWEYEKGVRPGMSESQRNTILNSDPTVAETMASMKPIFQQFKDAGWSQKDSEKAYAKENGYLKADGTYSLPKAIKSLFDEIW